MPDSVAEHTLTLSYNNIDSVKEVFAEIGEQIAAIIVEPVAGNMNCIPPVPGFLEGLRSICDEYSSVLIFDEVMTGFRVSLGGAQGHYQVTPDLTTLGKVIGGGLPVGAFGGKAEIMDHIAPTGPVYQAGTLSGNPLAMTAGLTMLEAVSAPGFYDKISTQTEKLVTGFKEIADTVGIPMSFNNAGSMFGYFFSEDETITSYEQVMACDQNRFKTFYHSMLEQGVYMAPSSFEAGFVSSAHDAEVIERTLGRVETALKACK